MNTDPQDELQAGLHEILDDLANLIETARTMPMSSSVLVNRAEALALVDEMRAALPEQLAHADQVLAQADEVFEDAKRQAEDLLNTARARAIELVQQEQVVVQAEARARDILAEAEQRATELKVDADDYCDRQLAEFEVDLGKTIAQVQAGRARLAERLGTGLVPDWPTTTGGGPVGHARTREPRDGRR